jgi:hypothetical protein
MVMLNVPFTRPKWGVELVRCLAVIARILHPNIQKLFAEHTPALKKFLEGLLTVKLRGSEKH